MTPAAWVVAAGLVLALAIALWPVYTDWRRRRHARRPLPSTWKAILRRRMPLFARLPPPLRARLAARMQVFMAEKRFYGCNGLVVTEEMRVTIAAYACLLVVGREDAHYPALNAILVYPDAFIVRRDEIDDAGVQWDRAQVLSGESWDSGRVILSWFDVCEGVADAEDGRNVVLHEFAHQLDAESGSTEGAPVLDSHRDYAEWSAVLTQAFDALRDDIESGLPHLMDAYAAASPAEFFAVATETFFEKAQALKAEQPALYAQLRRYYRLDPAAWTEPAAARDDGDREPVKRG